MKVSPECFTYDKFKESDPPRPHFSLTVKKE